MGAYLSLAALVLQVVFLGIVLSFVGVYTNRFIVAHLASRQSLHKSMSHAEAARARSALKRSTSHVTKSF